MRLLHRTLTGLAVASAAAVLAPAALASSSPTSSITEYDGTTQLSAGQAGQAASTSNLDLDLTFDNSSGDTPNAITINLPPGLLADASKQGSNGSCISEPASSPPDSKCLIGTGTVNATVGSGAATVAVGVDYYLVQGSSGDLGGLEVYNASSSAITGLLGLPLPGGLTAIPAIGQVGSTGDITIRPSGSADGVGATIALTNLPATEDGLSLSVTSIDSTFDNLRYPASCPSTAEAITGSATGTTAGDTASSFSSALPITGCANLGYNPQFSASATRDSADKGVSVTTDITQTASEAPNANVSLSFPTTMFGANLATLPNLCVNPASGTCKAVGSVTAVSPLYPTALTGAAYLSGNASGLTLVLTFPSPFPLTLTGQVNLNTNTASFTGLPDIPLSDLNVTLNGGPTSLFVATCQASSGSATAALSGQNGAAKTLTAAISYTGCPADNPPKGTLGGGTGSGPSSGGSSSTTVTPTTPAKVVSGSAKGLAKGRPTLIFQIKAGKKAAKLTRLTVKLPSGLSFRSTKQGKAKLVKGVTLTGAQSKSTKLSGKKLVIVLKSGSRSIKVKLSPRSLKESKALRIKAQKKALKSLTLHVTARNAKGKSKALKAKITKLNLG